MIAKVCANCVNWLYQESVAGIGLGSCESEDSEFAWRITPEDESCTNFVPDDFEYTDSEDYDEI